MVVGRAANRWNMEWAPSDAKSDAAAGELARRTLWTVTSDSQCPMSWVTDNWGTSEGYNTRRSAFWRGVRGVVDLLKIADVDTRTWPSKLVWSNLYKIAPHSGGNPSGALRKLLQDDSIGLFRAELSAYAPQRILFLTGIDWARPFIEGLGWVTKRCASSGIVEAIGDFPRNGRSGGAYVVAVHPQGKPRITWVTEVVQAFA